MYFHIFFHHRQYKPLVDEQLELAIGGCAGQVDVHVVVVDLRVARLLL